MTKILQTLFITYSHQQNSDVKFIYDNRDFTDKLIIKSDPNRFKQVLNNLLNNAFKFTESGKISFGYKIEEDKQIIFYVKDTGIGIAEDKLDVIFDRFRKIEDNNAKIYRGTGLGLTISKKLIELLGGKIWVESEFDKGSTFNFSIPF